MRIQYTRKYLHLRIESRQVLHIEIGLLPSALPKSSMSSAVGVRGTAPLQTHVKFVSTGGR